MTLTRDPEQVSVDIQSVPSRTALRYRCLEPKRPPSSRMRNRRLVGPRPFDFFDPPFFLFFLLLLGARAPSARRGTAPVLPGGARRTGGQPVSFNVSSKNVVPRPSFRRTANRPSLAVALRRFPRWTTLTRTRPFVASTEEPSGIVVSVVSGTKPRRSPATSTSTTPVTRVKVAV